MTDPRPPLPRHPIFGEPTRRECATCGWVAQSYSPGSTIHAGELHVTVFKPGHVLKEQETSEES